jgi:predicted transcriptional regulator
MTEDIKMSIRLPPELHARLSRAAEHDHRSRHGQMLFYVERGVTQDERTQKRLASRAASAGKDNVGTEAD